VTYMHIPGLLPTKVQEVPTGNMHPAWGDNSAKYKLTRVSANIYELMISPDIISYYGVPSGEKF
jgi:hypothetical protein